MTSPTYDHDLDLNHCQHCGRPILEPDFFIRDDYSTEAFCSMGCLINNLTFLYTPGELRDLPHLQVSQDGGTTWDPARAAVGA